MFELSLLFGLIVYYGVASGSVWILTVPADELSASTYCLLGTGWVSPHGTGGSQPIKCLVWGRRPGQ